MSLLLIWPLRDSTKFGNTWEQLIFQLIHGLFLSASAGMRVHLKPAQHGVLPVSKLIATPGATSCSLGTCAIAKVTAMVTDRVIYLFHAAFTFP
jgi:hypothetical protein